MVNTKRHLGLAMACDGTANHIATQDATSKVEVSAQRRRPEPLPVPDTAYRCSTDSQL